MKTLVVGASSNPTRYAYQAIEKLVNKGYPFIALGRSKGEVFGQTIHTEKINWSGIDTVTLYIAPTHQEEYYDYIQMLNPRRVIFNPGTENSAFERLLTTGRIQVERACTLVLLSTNQYESKKS